MTAASVVLTKYCVLDTDATKVKFSFKLENYPKFNKRIISKRFHFGGHMWKLQITKKDGYLGMFLRWYGTTTVENSPKKLNCKTALLFSVINKFKPDNSVSEGTTKEFDVFDTIRGGIGYSKIIPLDELEKTAGYILDGNLYLQLLLKIISTTYYDSVSASVKSEGEFVTGFKFQFYGTKWFVVLFPEGEKQDEKKEESVKGRKQQEGKTSEKTQDEGEQKTTSIYFTREPTFSHHLLRHNVTFQLAVEGGHSFTLEQHFHNKNSNSYGSASFMPVDELKSLSENGSVDVSVTFVNIVAYSYFAYNTSEDEEKISFGEGFHFHDHYNIPWDFALRHIAETEDDPFYGILTLYNKHKDGEKEKKSDKEKKFQVSWLVDILSPTDITESITFLSRSKRQVRDAIFSDSNETDVVEFPISIDEMKKCSDIFVDHLGSLSVRVSVICCNRVEEIGQKEIAKIYNDIQTYRHHKRKEETSEDENVKSEDKDDDKEVLLQSLFDHIDSYERYIKHLERNPKWAKSVHNETSIAALIERSRPSLSDCENLSTMAKYLRKIIQTLPLSIAKMIPAGAFGHGTIVANYYQLDFIIQLTDYVQQMNKLPLLLNVIKERVKEHSSSNPSEMTIDRWNAEIPLPYAHRFYKTGNALLFKLGQVQVTILLSRSFDHYGNYDNVYEETSNATKLSIHRFIIISCERQSEFIDQQTDVCKDLICVVKAWSNRVRWRNADSRPSSYLLSLLLIHAYEATERLQIANTPSFEKEVLTEFGSIILNDMLSIEWSYFYNPSDYPTENNSMFKYPIIRDPALPYHNVSATGIGNWIQLRQETEDWIISLDY